MSIWTDGANGRDETPPADRRCETCGRWLDITTLVPDTHCDPDCPMIPSDAAPPPDRLATEVEPEDIPF